ncbi:molecular chaperone [Bdellovibrio sp. HCB209]|uniref:fimbrial biogenesis chaperone n=1 Tax=Bdellovibrio sp. HCB209 TaxID=3394354 RepID=UPI0039B3841D
MKFFAVIPLILFCLPAFAFRLDPMVVTFAPSGKLATQVVTLDNPTNEKIPVQVEVFTRDESTGQEKREKTSEFTIYPEQVVLLPREKRNVRITFTGETPKEEKAYRIVATQLPVELKETNAKAAKKTGANVTFMLQYVASAYVAPKDVAADIKVKDVKVSSPKNISVTIANDGTAHKIVYVKSFKVLEKGKVVEEIKKPQGIEGTNILAKTQKTVSVPLSKSLKGNEATVSVEFAESAD